jgi:hypothetical protein
VSSTAVAEVEKIFVVARIRDNVSHAILGGVSFCGANGRSAVF